MPMTTHLLGGYWASTSSVYFHGSYVEMYGATKADLEGFAEAMAPADVVIVDQNMEYRATTMYSTNLLKQ